MMLNKEQSEQLVTNIMAHLDDGTRNRMMPNSQRSKKVKLSSDYYQKGLSYLTVGNCLIPLILIVIIMYALMPKLEPIWAFLLFIIFIAVAINYCLYHKYRDKSNKTDANLHPYPQKDDLLNELNVQDRLKSLDEKSHSFFSFITSKDEELSTLVLLSDYLKIACENDMNEQAEDLIENYPRLPVLAQGLTDLENIKNKSSKVNDVKDEYMYYLTRLLDDLEEMLEPTLEIVMTNLIKEKYYDLLPTDIAKDFSDKMSDELLK